MARIRSIHPGLFTDEAFMQLTVSAPLAVPLLLGLWGEADDQGLFEWKPLTIKARILPAVPADIGPLLEALVEGQFIQRFEVDGRSYGAIRNFRRWQRPEKPKALHPLPDSLRPYVGLVAGKSPNDRRPVADKSPKVSAEVGGRLEEVGGNLGEINPTTEARPPATAPASDGQGPAALGVTGIIRVFDEVGAEVYGPDFWSGHRPWPASQDHATATAMTEAGADPALCRPVFEALLRSCHAAGRTPPRSLAYAKGAVSDAVAAAKQGLPPPRVGPGPASTAEEDFKRLMAGVQ